LRNSRSASISTRTLSRTYIPMGQGFLYLFAVLDWMTRRVLSWQLSNTLSSDFCIEPVEAAIYEYGCPRIFDTDQGSQFTGGGFVALLKSHDIKSAWTAKAPGATTSSSSASWKSLKYEEVYLRALRNRRHLSPTAVTLSESMPPTI
ncbi:MAG: DDE-type integrase/transposase/recombinase, partial [Vulcanimicrobiaceae bacterium]